MAAGAMRVAGRLEGFAFVPVREAAGGAVAALQQDLCASLAARLQVHHRRHRCHAGSHTSGCGPWQ